MANQPEIGDTISFSVVGVGSRDAKIACPRGRYLTRVSYKIRAIDNSWQYSDSLNLNWLSGSASIAMHGDDFTQSEAWNRQQFGWCSRHSQLETIIQMNKSLFRAEIFAAAFEGIAA